MMKRFAPALFGAAIVCASTLAGAEDVGHGFDVSGNIAFTNDYRFRGISQTDEDFAVQGGFDVAHSSGFYAGTWASNLDESAFDGSQTEVDLYGGYNADLKNGWSVGLQYLYYYYPGASTAGGQADLDYYEIIPSASYSSDYVSGSLSLAYSPDFFLETGDSYYPNLSVSVPLPAGFGLGAHVGYQAIENNNQFGTPDYTDWSLSITHSFFSLDFSLAYVDTDLSDNECFGGSSLCDATGVFTIAKSF